jgi:predicted O-methyltransferase YrrM
MIRTENLRSGYIQDDVEEYLYQLLPERDAVVREIEDYAAQNRVPIIGPAVARMLALFVQVSGAKRIFEMGSAIGYSTIWLARAGGPKAKVIYTDGDPEKARRAKDYFRRAGVGRRIEVRVGDALELLKKTPGKFDVIFNDIDKHQYPAALRVALPKLRRGGLFITDNTLWSGKAALPSAGRTERNLWPPSPPPRRKFSQAALPGRKGDSCWAVWSRCHATGLDFTSVVRRNTGTSFASIWPMFLYICWCIPAT